MTTPHVSRALPKRETIDHGREHAHVIGSGAIHALMAPTIRARCFRRR